MALSRREFLRRSACSTLSAAALASGIDRFGLVQAFAQGVSYRALVCIFLGGGNDGNNMVVPLDAAGYAAYAAVRNAAGLAIAQASLLPVQPKSMVTPWFASELSGGASAFCGRQVGRSDERGTADSATVKGGLSCRR